MWAAVLRASVISQPQESLLKVLNGICCFKFTDLQIRYSKVFGPKKNIKSASARCKAGSPPWFWTDKKCLLNFSTIGANPSKENTPFSSHTNNCTVGHLVWEILGKYKKVFVSGCRTLYKFRITALSQRSQFSLWCEGAA